MTQDEIIEMARESGLAFDSDEYPEIWQTYMNVGKQEIKAFADLVAAKATEEANARANASWTLMCKKMVALEREALAQPEQEPVALQDDEIYDAAFSAYCRGENSRELFRIMWSNRLTCSIGWDRDELKSFARNIAALYTHPPQRTWVRLTDEEIKKISKKHKWHEGNVEPHLMPVFRSLEAKLKELNS